jgi:hypothetical protein
MELAQSPRPPPELGDEDNRRHRRAEANGRQRESMRAAAGDGSAARRERVIG